MRQLTQTTGGFKRVTSAYISAYNLYKL